MNAASPEHLPAKSRYGSKPPRSLLEHSLDAEQAAELVFRLQSRWGQNYCRLFGLDSNEERERFLLHLRIAALFHDLGKANEEFVGVVLGGKRDQTLRHEHISAVILCLPAIRSWLEAGGIDVDVITAAVLSHHLKAGEQEGDLFRWGACRRSPTLRLWLDHLDVRSVLERVQEVAGLADPPALPADAWVDAGGVWYETLKTGRKLAHQFRRALKRDSDGRQRLHLAVKAALISADAVASAMIREGHDPKAWVEDVVRAVELSSERVFTDVIGPRCSSVSAAVGSPFMWQDFQERAAEQPERTLLLAACGAGKTLAAWRWAAAQCDASPLGKVLFLYPTRGTATEGFRDYVGWAPEADAALMHGTSRYELQGMLSNPSEALKGKDLSELETDQRLFALGVWSKRYFSATVDQFLAFLEHRYDSLCLLPVLADAAIIIDEVHSFSTPMFKKLIAFLTFFRGPVLCMTATLPQQRIERLRKAGLKVYPQPGQTFEDLAKRERAPRYAIHLVSSAEDALAPVVDAYRNGRRVLWVVNTVDRCQEMARRLEAKLGVSPLVYHSRFRLQDRQCVHARTVRAFQQTLEPAIAVTTQVCEMSLDLDAHVLVTELAPFTSLVQRFGRANRKLNFDRAEVYVYEPEGSAPYDREELAASRALLSELRGSDRSQAELAESLERYKVHELTSAPNEARFLEAGYYAIAGDFRESDRLSVQVLLNGDEDLQTAKRMLSAGEAIDGLLLPVPRSFAFDAPESAGLPRHIKLAERSRYDERLGFIAKAELG